MRRSLTLSLAVAIVLVAAGATPALGRSRAPSAPVRCCFRVSIDVQGSYRDEYQGTASSQWKGSASGRWDWTTRFVAAYTGKGVAVVGDFAMAQAGSSSRSEYDIILNKPLPPKHKSCGGGKESSARVGSDNFQRVASRGSLIHAARNVGGYDRALIVDTPHRISFACSFLGENVLESVDTYAVKAPSVENFLGGKSFQRSCWRSTTANLPNPFPHTVTTSVLLGIKFTYFRKDQLKQNQQTLSKLNGKVISDPQILSRAEDDQSNKGDPANGSRCF